LGIWNLSKATLKYIYHIKYSEKGIETSPDGKYVAVAEKKNGKDYICIYHSNSFIQLEVYQHEINIINLRLIIVYLLEL
jgi:hypothetical protein